MIHNNDQTVPLPRRNQSTSATSIPRKQFTTLHRRMDDLLVRTFGHTRLPQIILSDGFNFEPIVEIKNIGDKVLLFTAVPGYNAEDIQVKATANRVQITGERKTLTTAAGPQGETSRLDEVCRFSIVSILPAEVDPDKSKVMVHSGMLIVVIPKTEQAKAKMNIEAGK